MTFLPFDNTTEAPVFPLLGSEQIIGWPAILSASYSPAKICETPDHR